MTTFRSRVLLVALTLVVGGPACEAMAGGPYQGQVVDARTKEPLSGAVVLVYWNLAAPAIGHGPAEEFLDSDEAITDAEGRFVVARNPPIASIPGTWVRSPTITIFKPGYGYFPRYFSIDPPLPPTGHDGLLRLMESQTVVFSLPRLATRNERLDVIGTINPMVVPGAKKTQFLRLLNAERAAFYLPPAYEGGLGGIR
jgi:hypothetical protein